MRSYFRLGLALLLALSAASIPAYAAGDALDRSAGVEMTGQTIIETSADLTPAAVMDRFVRGDGKPHDPRELYPFRPGVSVWLWLDVPRHGEAGEGVLTVPYSGLDLARLHLLAADGSWTHLQAGDLTAVNKWVIPHRYAALPVQLGPTAPARALLELQHSHPVTMPWRLQTLSAFTAENLRVLLTLGMYLGLVFLVVVLGGVNSYVLWDPLHMVYAVSIFVVAITQMSLNGLAGQFLWPASPWWNDTATLVLPVLSVVSSSLFVMTVIRPVPRIWLLRLFQLFLALGVFFVATILAMGRPIGMVLSNLYFVAAIPMVLGPLVWFSIKRSSYGWWLVAGFAFMFAGAIFIPLRNAGLISMNWLTQYGAQVGSAIEIPMLLIGLHLLSRRRRDALIRRTALQTSDPVTGLANDRVTRERLEHLVYRMRGQPGRSCVMRVRIGNYSKIVADYGIQTGVVTSARAAPCLALITNVGDTLGTLSNGDFLLVLERGLTEKEALQEATRVVARGLSQPSRSPPFPAIGFFVAVSLAPEASENADRLLAQLDRVLQEITADPRKVIRVVRQTQLPDAAGLEPATVG